MTARRTAAATVLLAGLLMAGICASLLLGTRLITPTEVLQGLRHTGPADIVTLVWSYRVPRTAVAVGVGAALGVAGALIQALTRNPLADPGILGVNAGAAFGATVTVAISGQVVMSALVAPALVGALVATLAVLALGRLGRGASTPVRMTLAGVAFAAVIGGITTTMRLTNPTTFDQMRAWAAGSVAGRSLSDLGNVAVLFAIGIVAALAVARPLDAIALGDDRAASLGVNVPTVRIVTVLAVSLLCGGATALVGPIGFVGLMVPHACRWLVGPNNRHIVALSVLAAPTLLLTSDVVARIVLGSREIPVGLVTAFLGAPILIALARSRKVHEL